MALNAKEWKELTVFLEHLVSEGGVAMDRLPCQVAVWPSPPDPRDFKFANFAKGVELLSAFSRRDEMPPVRNQSPWGTCVSFGIGHAQKGWQERQQGDYPEGGLSPAFLYARCKARDGLAQPGTYPRVALQVLLEEGICSEKSWPYERLGSDVHPNQPPQSVFEEAKKYRIAAYAGVSGVAEIRRAIREQGPVPAAVLVCDNFLEPYKGKFIPLPQGFVRGSHLIAFTDYDDKLRFPWGDVGGLLVMNSWGEDWGDNGYAWLPYEFVTHRISLNGNSFPALFEAWTSLDLPYQLLRAGKIILKIGERRVWVDGEEFEYDVAPVILPPGRTMVPIRLIAERLGCIVNWQKETGIVEIVNPAKEQRG